MTDLVLSIPLSMLWVLTGTMAFATFAHAVKMYLEWKVFQAQMHGANLKAQAARQQAQRQPKQKARKPYSH